jgi:hypothetical protein
LIRARRFRCGNSFRATKWRRHSKWRWSDLSNGDLLEAAEKHFDVFVTTDQQLRHQQNLSGRKIAVLVLPFASWPKLQGQAAEIAVAIAGLTPGAYAELQPRVE